MTCIATQYVDNILEQSVYYSYYGNILMELQKTIGQLLDIVQ